MLLDFCSRPLRGRCDTISLAPASQRPATTSARPRMPFIALLLCAAAQPDAAKLDTLFAPWDKPKSPGLAVAVVRDGSVVYSKGFGSANLELGVPISTRTAFNIGS